MISRSAARKPFGLQMATEGPASRGLPSDASEFFLRVEDGKLMRGDVERTRSFFTTLPPRPCGASPGRGHTL
jgi:hypothetical protein